MQNVFVFPGIRHVFRLVMRYKLIRVFFSATLSMPRQMFRMQLLSFAGLYNKQQQQEQHDINILFLVQNKYMLGINIQHWQDRRKSEREREQRRRWKENTARLRIRYRYHNQNQTASIISTV